jgi:hypothetical protein
MHCTDALSGHTNNYSSGKEQRLNKHLARIAAVTAVLWALPFTLAFAGDNTWTVSGPPGGLVSRLVASPTDANASALPRFWRDGDLHARGGDDGNRFGYIE